MVTGDQAAAEQSPTGERSFSALFSDKKKFELLSDEAAYRLARFFNYFGLIVPMLVVLAAMGYQVFGDELPCSHCNMQRLGFFMLALGPALNLRFGFRPSHYGISLAGAFFLGTVALDMMVRISNQNLDGWGPKALGLHMYGWSLVIALIGGVALVVMFLWERQFDLSRTAEFRPSRKASGLLVAAFAVALVIIGLDLVSVIFECGIGLCPDAPPTDYPFLSWIVSLL
ncbi:MAG: disulfide bond formation protein B [Micrococcales bacterium]|nr:disulfide bond formation protein B [Micrococcales bacterium]